MNWERDLSAAIAVTAGVVASLGVVAQANDGGEHDGSVQVRNNVFSPQTVTVRTGRAVNWTWPSGSFNHDVVADNGSFDSGAPTNGPDSYRRTFSQAGTFRYYCSIHGGPGGVGMSGKVVVVDPDAAPAPTRPTVRLRVRTRLRASSILRHRRLSGRTRLNRAGRVTATVTATRRVRGKNRRFRLARGTVRFSSSGTRTVKMRLTSAGRREVRKVHRRKRTRITTRITARGRNNDGRTARKTIRRTIRR